MSEKLRIIPKPEGFELRSRRVRTKEDGSLWTADDVLFDVSQEIKGKPISEMIVIWREDCEDDDSSYYTKSRRATQSRSDAAEMLINMLGQIMGWR